MKSAAATLAILAVLTNAYEEHNFELEDTIIDGLTHLTKDQDIKFISYESHLGLPAMHEEPEDSKWLLLGCSNGKRITLGTSLAFLIHFSFDFI